MSEAKKINEGAVTSLADTDLVLATDASGTPRPLPLSHLLSLIRSNIHIGGRNLVKNSGIPVTTSEYWIKSYPYAETPEIGESIIVTIWGELGAGKSNFYVFNGNGDGTYGLSKLSKVEEGVYRGVINIGRKATAPYEIIKVYAYPQSVTGVSSTINRIKVERGNIATDWTPAPEDLGWGG